MGKPGYPFDVQPQLVSQVIDQVVDQEKILLASKGIRLVTACPAELIWTLDEDLVIGRGRIGRDPRGDTTAATDAVEHAYDGERGSFD